MTLLEIATSNMNYVESLFFKEFENIILFIICSSFSFFKLYFSRILKQVRELHHFILFALIGFIEKN